MQVRNLPKVQHKPTILKGGLNLVEPSLSIGAGYATYSVNYECSISGGYSRIKGYERKDGQPSPSAAVYTIVQIVGFLTTPTLGQTLTGNTSAATGIIVGINGNYMALTKVVGTFTTSEIVKVGAVTIGTATVATVIIGALEKARLLNAAADIYRADITAVGGASSSGSVLGVFVYNDIVHAFRNNAGGTAADLWKATGGGWAKIAMVNEVTFDTAIGTGIGNAIPPAEAAVGTGGTSGKTVTLRRVMLATGAWRTAATTADGGRFIYSTLNGIANFTVGETVTFTGGATAIVRAVGTAITIAPTGKYEFYTGNFFGQLGTLRVYGVDGVNRLFEFDGTYYMPITTGAVPDTPKHIAIHKGYLAISIATSLFLSEVGQPYRWATGTETPTGDTISGLIPQPGSQATGALGVFCRENVFVLYGTAPTGSTPFNLVPFNVGSGAIDYSQQNAGQTFFFNNEGVTNLQTTLNFGNFISTSLTFKVNPFVIANRTKFTNSILSRLKNQYRMFFNDGTGLYITVVNGKTLGCMPVFFPSVVNVTWAAELNTGDSAQYIGCTDGFVYEMEKGTSFDGANIDALMILNWDNDGSPRMLKAYKHASIEMRSETYASIQFSYQLAYGSQEIDIPIGIQAESFLQGFTLWDVMTWDDFYWDGQSLLPSEVDMTGTGENVQIAIGSSSDYIDSYTINSVITHYTMRRALR